MKKKCNVLQADFSITGIRPQNIYIYSRLKSTYVLDKEVRQSTLVSLSLWSSCYPVAASFFLRVGRTADTVQPEIGNGQHPHDNSGFSSSGYCDD